MLPSSKTSSAVAFFSLGSSGREIFVPGDNDDERQSLLEVEEGRVVVAKKKRNVFTVFFAATAVLLVAFAGLATKNDEKDVRTMSSLGEGEEELSSSSSNDNDGRRLTFTLYTGCSPMDKVMPALRRGESEGENDVPYDWSARVGAKLVLKDDDENVGGNDFSFARGIPMEQVSCGTYRATTALMKRGTAFGFALYEISSSSSSSSSAMSSWVD